MSRSKRPPKSEVLLDRMCSRDAQVAEDAFGLLGANLETYINDLIRTVKQPDLESRFGEGVTSWLLELLACTKAPEVAAVIAVFLSDPSERIRSSARRWLEVMDT